MASSSRSDQWRPLEVVGQASAPTEGLWMGMAGANSVCMHVWP